MRNKRLAILSGITIVASMLALTPVPARAGWAGGGGYHAGESGGFRGGSYTGRTGAYRGRYAGGYYRGGYYGYPVARGAAVAAGTAAVAATGWGWNGGGYYGGGCCYHPVATAAAVTATAVVTAAVVGAIVDRPPAGCVTQVINGLAYQQCGSTWYQPQMSGTTTTYVVVNAPR